MDILEQLEQKILGTISALTESRKEQDVLRDEKIKADNQIEELKQQLNDAEERLQYRDTAITALQQQYEATKKENVRLTHEKNEWATKVTALMETIEQSAPA